jgi:HSP20 family molecular chaperone IbpA
MSVSNLQSLFDLFETQLPSYYSNYNTQLSEPSYIAKKLEDGKQELTLSVLGHDVKNIKLEVTDETVIIKAKKKEGSSPLVEDIDITFSVGKDYDGTKTEAKFSNGLLVLTIDKKEERKSKSVSIKVG